MSKPFSFKLQLKHARYKLRRKTPCPSFSISLKQIYTGSLGVNQYPRFQFQIEPKSWIQIKEENCPTHRPSSGAGLQTHPSPFRLKKMKENTI